MVTVPVVNERGLQAKCLINNAIKIGGQIQVQSRINPAANGTWQVYKLGFDISTWESPFYWLILRNSCGLALGIPLDGHEFLPLFQQSGQQRQSVGFAAPGSAQVDAIPRQPAPGGGRGLQPLDESRSGPTSDFSRDANGIQIKRAQIASVPVRMWGGGRTFASANLVAGDLGWLHANDRDISLFKQSFGNAPPNTKRQHSFEDAVFEPDPIEGVTIASGHSNDFVIQAKDGSSCAAFNTTNNVIELDSTTKAFQIPRMTTAQRDAIPTPRGGQMVYVTDSIRSLTFRSTRTGSVGPDGAVLWPLIFERPLPRFSRKSEN